MTLTAPLLLALAQFPVDARAGESQLQQLQQSPTTTGVTFTWQDTDDALKGTISPVAPRADEELTVSATLQALAGPEFEGPLTFALRPLETMGATQTVTVTRAPGERSYVAHLTPREPGPHRLELSWRGTRHKVVRGVVTVEPAGLPRWFSWAVGVSLVAFAVLGGVWSLFRNRESTTS